MVPVRKGDHSRVVIDVVERRMRVIGVVDDEGATKTVAVLSRQVAVVPESAGLVGCGEVVQERIVLRDRTLVDESRAVSVVRPLLEEPVPVLDKRRVLMRLQN